MASNTVENQEQMVRWLTSTNPLDMVRVLEERQLLDRSVKTRLVLVAVARQFWGSLSKLARELARELICFVEKHPDQQIPRYLRDKVSDLRTKAYIVQHSRQYGKRPTEEWHRLWLLSMLGVEDRDDLTAWEIASPYNSVNVFFTETQPSLYRCIFSNIFEPPILAVHRNTVGLYTPTDELYQKYKDIRWVEYENHLYRSVLTDVNHSTIFFSEYLYDASEPLQWFAWNHQTIPKIVRNIVENQRWDLTPELAEALEDSGCTHLGILLHLRNFQRRVCCRCEGDGKAHGSDRPFEWHPDTDYGKCVVCKGSGLDPQWQKGPATHARGCHILEALYAGCL